MDHANHEGSTTMIKHLLWLLPLLVAALAACTSTPIELPLAEDKPTFIFFYTDG